MAPRRSAAILPHRSPVCRAWTALLALAVLFSATATGCRTSRAALTAIDPVALNRDLHLQLDQHLAEVTATASEIAAEVPDRLVRENCLRWKMRALNAYLDVLAIEEPRAAFLQEWVSVVEFRQYLASPEGSGLFGPQQASADALAARMEADTLALGRKHFPPDVIEAAKDDVEAAAASYSRKTAFGGLSLAQPTEAQADLLRVLRLPLLPIAVLEGASSTPKAIERFTDTARDFATTVRLLPEQTRWQVELLLLEMESTGPAAVLARAAEGIEQTVRDATETVRTLPAETRVQAEKSLESVAKLQPALQETLAQARAAVEGAQQAVREGQATAEAVGKAAEQAAAAAGAFQAAATEVRGVLADYGALPKPESESGAASSETVADYRLMADSMAEAAKQVRALIAELHQPLPQEAAVGQFGEEVRAVVNVAFWRLVALAAIVFVLALVYRRLTRGRTAGPQG